MRFSAAHPLQPGGERGQTLPLLALVLVVMLGAAAIVVDLGRAYVVQRSLQSSTDAAALAAAQELPNPGDAIAIAEAYGGEAGAKNEHAQFPPVTTTATTECRTGKHCSPVNAVVVNETARVPTGFAKLFGLDFFDVSTRAVAVIQPGNVPWAIFATTRTAARSSSATTATSSTSRAASTRTATSRSMG